MTSNNIQHLGRLQQRSYMLVCFTLAILLFPFSNTIIGTIVPVGASDERNTKLVHGYGTCPSLNGWYMELDHIAQCPNTMSKLQLQYNTKTWKLDPNGQTYSTFLTSLRNELSSGIYVCGKPVTSKTPTTKYVLVELQPKSQNIITLALRVSDGYFVGFQDKFNGAFRANFVKDEFSELKGSDLFKDAKIREELPYKSTYNDIINVAGSGREELLLGVKDLASIIDIVYGKDYKGKNKTKDIGRHLAKFALISIQMVSEAVRFKYIEDKVKSSGMGKSFYPNGTFIDFENNWGSISTAIHKSAPNCGPVKLPKFPWDDIKPQVSLLKFA